MMRDASQLNAKDFKPGFTQVVIVRHGDTFAPGQIVTRVGARTDLPLVDSGVWQAENLASAFQFCDWAFDSAACSPLQRTRLTAEIILAAQAKPPLLEVASFLTEIDYGPDENQPESVVAARLGPALALWEECAMPPPGWLVDPAALGAAWRSYLSALERGGRHLIVTSNGVARFALYSETGAALPKLKTGAYGVILVGADAPAEVAAWNIRPDAQ